jgi:4-amino-4-deoxy-L-arabinose transferase-like glycosyltransferase
MTNRVLSSLNTRTSSRVIIRWLGLSIFFFSLFVFIAPQITRGKLGALPEEGDGPDYDMMAVQLTEGNGFSCDWDDPNFSYPYAADNQDQRYQYLLDRHGQGPTAYRPPLLPLLMAASFKIFGRHFAPIRFLNSIFLALAVVIAFAVVARRFGVIPGLLCTVLLLLVDFRLSYYASQILTEPQAVLLMTLMFWCLLRSFETKSIKWIIALGMVAGVAFLARTVFIFWIPATAIAIFLLTKPANALWISRRSFRNAALLVGVSLVFAMPWMIRNCVILHKLAPLGTQGDINLISEYSDPALQQGGIWDNPDRFGLFNGAPLQGKSLLEQEKIKADFSRAQALNWIARNPLKLPSLALHKVQNEWRPMDTSQLLVLGLAALGFVIVLSLYRIDATAYLTMFATCTVVIAATHSVRGRFLVPMVPILISLSAIGLWSFILACTESAIERLRPKRAAQDE